LHLLETKPGRAALFSALYFSEGAPIGYIWWALPAKLREAGVPIGQATALTALIAWPWTLKFLWAPLIDTLRSPRWGHREWIIAAQLGMGAALLPLLWLSPAESLRLAGVALLCHALLAATQDVSVDAFCIASVPAREHGSINGWMQFGMLLGRGVFGGLALWIEQRWGERCTIALLIACVWSSALLVWTLPRHGSEAPPSGRGAALDRFLATLAKALSKRATWLALLFAATGGAAFEAVGGLAGAILIDHGVPKAGVGLFNAGPVVIAMAAGALAGGALSDRLGRKRSVLAAGLAIVALVLALAAVLRAPEVDTFALRAILAGVYLSIGVFTATTYALFMDLTDPALGATQFSAFMGATNLCEVWSVYLVGRLLERIATTQPQAPPDYPRALAIMACLALAALLTLRWLRLPERPH